MTSSEQTKRGGKNNMSASLTTIVTLRGTKEELIAMIRAIRDFADSSKKQYQESRNCGYIEPPFPNMTDAAIEKLVGRLKEITLEMDGPYGAFEEPYQVPIFERIADAAPTASFTGETSGFVTGASIGTDAKFNNGTLSVTAFYTADEDSDEEYLDYLLENLPLDTFCTLFKIDKDLLEEDAYSDFLMEQIAYEEITKETTREELADMLGIDEDAIDEKAFKKGLKEILGMKLRPIDEYCSESKEPAVSESYTYHPEVK